MERLDYKKNISHLITKLQRVLGVDLLYLSKGLAWLTSGQVLLSGLAMISAVAFANLLPQEIFGKYRFVLSIVGILSLTTLTGLDTALFRAASRGYENTVSLFIKKRFVFGLLGSVGALIGSTYYYYNDNTLLTSALLIAAVFVPLHTTFNFYNVLLNARRRFGTSTLYRVLARAILLVSLIVSIYLSDNLLVIVTVNLAVGTLTHFLLYKKTIADIKPKGGTDSEALGYGYHLSFLGAFGSVTSHAYNIALFHFIGAASVAQYYFAIAPTEQLRGVISQIETLLFPRFAKDSWHLMAFGAFARKIAPFVGILTLIVIAYVLAAPLLFKLLFPQYIDVVFLSQIYAPTILVTTVNVVLTTILKSKGLIKSQYILNMYTAAFSLCVVIPLIAVWGLVGLVVGILLQKLTLLAYMCVLLFSKKNA